MKKFIIVCILALSFASCKQEAKSTEETVETTKAKTANQNDGLTLLRGEFVYYSDAAVLQTPNQIYGVILNEKLDELNKQAEPFKKEATDFVMVEVRGKVQTKPEGEEGWENRVEIKDILKVSAVEKQVEVVKLGSKK